MLRRLKAYRPSPAFVIASIALFVAMGGVAYASVSNNSVRSRHIVNDAVTSADIKGGGGRTGDIKNRDVNALLAVAKGFASVQNVNANGPAPVLNFGGQQTATNAPGVTAARVGVGQYDVTFPANTGTGGFVRVDSVDDLTWQVNARNAGGFGNVFATQSSANSNQVRLRVIMRNVNGNVADGIPFSVQFYARTTN